MINVEAITGSDDTAIQIRRVMGDLLSYVSALEARVAALEAEEQREKAAASRRKAKTDAQT